MTNGRTLAESVLLRTLLMALMFQAMTDLRSLSVALVLSGFTRQGYDYVLLLMEV